MMPDFKIDSSLPAFDFYEGADLTALGRPLKTDKQITPPFLWTRPPNGTAVQYKCGPRFAFWQDWKFYKIRVT